MSTEPPEGPPPPDEPPAWLDVRPTNSQVAAASAAASRGPAQTATVHKIKPVEKDLRPLRSRSYLSILTILERPELRKRVFGQDTAIELNTLRSTVTIDRRATVDDDASIIRSGAELSFQADDKGNGMRFSIDDIERALSQVAAKRPYHPVVDYLRGLTWDGVDRIPWLATTVLGIANPPPLVLTMLRKWLRSACARAHKPGCQVDTVLVLVGDQGAQKSQFLHALCADPSWYRASRLEPDSKDGQQKMSGQWIYEWAEMARSRVSHGDIKGFVTTGEDVFRPPYGRREVSRPRTCVIAATINDDDFHRDSTGGRRWWPVGVGLRIDLDEMVRGRDQLWAQMQAEYAAGGPACWWLTPEEEVEHARHLRAFTVVTAWDEMIGEWLGGQVVDEVTLSQVLQDGVKIRAWTGSDEHRAAESLRRLGWHLTRGGHHGESRPRVWRRKS